MSDATTSIEPAAKARWEAPLDIEQIQAILPHRYPFLLVDRVLEMDPHRSIKALKNVSANEAHFVGHFPERKVMPGVLIVEALAQAAAIMELVFENRTGWIVFLTGVDDARFRRPVVPGDALILEAALVKARGPFGTVHARATVNGELAAECDIKYALQEPQAGAS